METFREFTMESVHQAHWLSVVYPKEKGLAICLTFWLQLPGGLQLGATKSPS